VEPSVGQLRLLHGFNVDFDVPVVVAQSVASQLVSLRASEASFTDVDAVDKPRLTSLVSFRFFVSCSCSDLNINSTAVSISSKVADLDDGVASLRASWS
jgi:hypothetical protein